MQQTQLEVPKNFLEILEERFLKNNHRHPQLSWEQVEQKLRDNLEKLKSIYAMELTGGEPDVLVFNSSSESLEFVDCSKESPSGRRSLCYDAAAWASRKANKPVSSVEKMALEMGVVVLNEQEYSALQRVEAFDTKTSSWVKTPLEIRNLGGALFGDYRYGKVFFYHNGAESYYAARGFRAKVVL